DDEAWLTLNAGNNIIFDSDIVIGKRSGNSGSLNLQLNAGVGDITFNSGSYIETWGGDFVASGRNFDVSTSTGNPVVSTDGGSILLNMSGAVWLRREVKTNGGDFTVGSSSSFTNN